MRKEISFPPSTGLVRAIRRAGYEWSEAVLDILDNAYDACKKKVDHSTADNYVKMEVVRNKTTNHIIIADNGIGIPEENFPSVLSLGESQKTGNDSLGTFGMGLKSASMSLGDVLTVVSTTTDISELSMVQVDWFDLENKGEFKCNQLAGSDVPEEYVSLFEKHVGSDSSGTLVVIERLLSDVPSDASHIRQRIRELCSIKYRYLLNKGMKNYFPFKFIIGSQAVTTGVDPLCPDDHRCRHLIHGDAGINSLKTYKIGDTELQVRMVHVPLQNGESKANRPANLGYGLNRGRQQGVYYMRNGREIAATPFKKTQPYANIYAELHFIDTGCSDGSNSIMMDFGKKGVVVPPVLQNYIDKHIFGPHFVEINNYMIKMREERASSGKQEAFNKVEQTVLPVEFGTKEDFSAEEQKDLTTRSESRQNKKLESIFKPANSKEASKREKIRGTTLEIAGENRGIRIEEQSWRGSDLGYDVEYRDGDVVVMFNTAHSWIREHIFENENEFMSATNIRLVCSFAIPLVHTDRETRHEIIESNMAVLKCLDESFGTFNDVEIVEKSNEEAA